MSAFVDGYNAMDQSYARAAQRALLQREYDDKVAERNRLLAERDATRALMGSGIDTMSRTADDTQQFFDRYGLTPQYDPAFADANPRAAAYGLRRGDGPTMQAPTPEPAPMPTAKPNPLRERGLQAMRLGQSTGNMDLYLQGQRAVDALDMQSGASNVYQAVLGADQRTLDAFANKFTAHTKIPGNMVVGKDGITRLTFDDGKAITMDRGQLAQYVTALYRMDKGDATAIKDIGAINTELASRASDAFKNMHTVATTNNQATGIARQMQHYGTLEARAGAAAAERKSVMDAAKPYLDKYEQLSDADKNGPAGVSLLRQAQVAAARKSGDLNQVVQGLLPKGKGALSPEQDKNYRAALMELGPRPAPTTGFFGGLDDSAGKTWDTRNNWIRSVYGVSDPSAAGGDQTDEILARVKAKLEGGDTTAKPPTPRAAPVPVAQNPAAPTMSPQEQRAARIAEIRQALAVDDDIKSSWTGMGLRAVSNRAFPMGMGTRFEMERELARLTGG